MTPKRRLLLILAGVLLMAGGSGVLAAAAAVDEPSPAPRVAREVSPAGEAPFHADLNGPTEYLTGTVEKYTLGERIEGYGGPCGDDLEGGAFGVRVAPERTVSVRGCEEALSVGASVDLVVHDKWASVRVHEPLLGWWVLTGAWSAVLSGLVAAAAGLFGGRSRLHGWLNVWTVGAVLVALPALLPLGEVGRGFISTLCVVVVVLLGVPALAARRAPSGRLWRQAFIPATAMALFAGAAYPMSNLWSLASVSAFDGGEAWWPVLHDEALGRIWGTVPLVSSVALLLLSGAAFVKAMWPVLRRGGPVSRAAGWNVSLVVVALLVNANPTVEDGWVVENVVLPAAVLGWVVTLCWVGVALVRRAQARRAAGSGQPG